MLSAIRLRNAQRLRILPWSLRIVVVAVTSYWQKPFAFTLGHLGDTLISCGCCAANGARSLVSASPADTERRVASEDRSAGLAEAAQKSFRE